MNISHNILRVPSVTVQIHMIFINLSIYIYECLVEHPYDIIFDLKWPFNVLFFNIKKELDTSRHLTRKHLNAYKYLCKIHLVTILSEATFFLY